VLSPWQPCLWPSSCAGSLNSTVSVLYQKLPNHIGLQIESQHHPMPLESCASYEIDRF
jgi:hypothetical protein